MKRILLGFIVLFVVSNSFGLSGFFNYILLNKEERNIVRDYTKKYDRIDILSVCKNKKDSSYTLIGGLSYHYFIEYPPYYYSVCDGRLIFYYNGIEDTYFPKKEDFIRMVDFLSNYVETKPVVEWDWEKYVFTEKRSLMCNVKVLYDPDIVKYTVRKDSINAEVQDYKFDSQRKRFYPRIKVIE